MATLNLNGPLAINMNVGDLVRFDKVDGNPVGGSWSWITPEGTDIDLDGSGLTYDAGAHANGGTVNSVSIDVGNDDFANPNIEITGLTVGATALDDSPEAFWRAVLGGDDVINGPSVAETGTGTSQLFGDGISVPTGSNDAGDDFMTLGDASIVAVGDVTTVGSNGGFTGLNGGNDQIFVGATNLVQLISGDADDVLGGGALFAGNDLIEARSANVNSRVTGDADLVLGVGGQKAFVQGGDDRISGLGGSTARLVGDVNLQSSNSAIKGGADRIYGSDQGEVISGDVGDIIGSTVQSLTGGADTLNGNGGEDIIAGDVLDAVAGARFTGGDDSIHGGADADEIFGDILGANAEFVFPGFKGGNDVLFGDAGDDFVFGQTGDDRLEGGTGADSLDGGTGFDIAAYGTAAYGTAKTGVTADLLRLDLNTGDAAGDSYAGIEALSGSKLNDSLRGDNAGNKLFGGDGGDALVGRGGVDKLLSGLGDDRLDGGVGNDLLTGGLGKDTFVFNAGYDVDRAAGFANGQDRLDLRGFDFGSFAEVEALATDTAGGDLRFAFGGGDVLLVDDFSLAEFTATDVLL